MQPKCFRETISDPDPRRAVCRIVDGAGTDTTALVCVFVDAQYDLDALAAELRRQVHGPILACTTARPPDGRKRHGGSGHGRHGSGDGPVPRRYRAHPRGFTLRYHRGPNCGFAPRTRCCAAPGQGNAIRDPPHRRHELRGRTGDGTSSRRQQWPAHGRRIRRRWPTVRENLRPLRRPPFRQQRRRAGAGRYHLAVPHLRLSAFHPPGESPGPSPAPTPKKRRISRTRREKTPPRPIVERSDRRNSTARSSRIIRCCCGGTDAITHGPSAPGIKAGWTCSAPSKKAWFVRIGEPTDLLNATEASMRELKAQMGGELLLTTTFTCFYRSSGI